MVYLTELWLPILVAAVLVFIASSILHMVLPFHRSDYKKLPKEEKALEAIRGAAPGYYLFPCPDDPKDMQSEELMKKFEAGPCGFVTVIPTGRPNMGKNLSLWFLYCILAGIFVAYLTGRCLGAEAAYLQVFRMAGTVAFAGYGLALMQDSIWRGQPWVNTFKHLFDSLIYALLTAGAFGWLWP